MPVAPDVRSDSSARIGDPNHSDSEPRLPRVFPNGVASALVGAVKADLAVVALRETTVEDEYVEVHVQQKRRAEAMNHRQRARLTTMSPRRATSCRYQAKISRMAMAWMPRTSAGYRARRKRRCHGAVNAHVRKHPVDPVGGALGHAMPPT